MVFAYYNVTHKVKKDCFFRLSGEIGVSSSFPEENSQISQRCAK
uniref:Uncharacterized protein n=1 Tax=Anguilla anguilla TaxID=7936 RepID=A0A0E9UBM4_ANGAN